MKRKALLVLIMGLLLCSCSRTCAEKINSEETHSDTSNTERCVPKKKSAVTSETECSEQTSSNDELSEQIVLEQLVLTSANQQSESGGQFSFEYYDPMFGDFDKDGKNELIALVADPDGELDFWFACDGKAQFLSNWYEWLEPEIVTSGENTFIKLEKAYVSQSVSEYYLLENSSPLLLETYGIQGLYPDGDNGDFTGCHSTYDSLTDGTGHTWKTYWFYYKDGEFNEYVGKEITSDELLEYDGSQAIIDEIKDKGGIVTHILKRENGIININYSVPENDMTDVPDTFFSFHYRTLRINDDSVYDITRTYEFENGEIEFYNPGIYQPSMLDGNTYYTGFIDRDY